MATSSLLTAEEAAAKLQITPQTLKSYLRQGKIRGLMVAGKWRITEAAFEAFIEEQERSSQPKGTASVAKVSRSTKVEKG